MHEASDCITACHYEDAMDALARAYHRLEAVYQLRLLPNWPVAVGVDGLAIFCFERSFAQQGRYGFYKQPSEKSCRFFYDLLVDTIIKVEQMYNERWKPLRELMPELFDT